MWKSAEADWNVFRQCIDDQIIATDVTDDDIDQLNSKIVDIIISAADRSFPRNCLQTSEASAVLER